MAEAATVRCDPEQVRLAIDIGHTPDAPGAVSARGRPEHAFNVDVASAIATLLEGRSPGVASVLHAPDAAPSLSERVAAAAEHDADLFLSIHHDSLQPRFLEEWRPEGADRPLEMSRYAAGYSLFVSDDNADAPASVEFARSLAYALQEQGFGPTLHHAEPIPGENRPLVDAALGIYRFDGLYVLRNASMPAVLFEVGVIKHPEEELMLRDPRTHRQVAEAVAAALQHYCTGSF